MTTPHSPLLAKTVAVAAFISLLTACAPPPSIPQQSGNLTLDMRRMQSSLDRQEQTIEELSSQVQELKEEQQRMALEIEQLRRQPAAAQPGYRPAGLPQTSETGVATTPGEGSPTEVYLQAFGDYASGRYQSAVHGFESFLQRFPNNSYASNAQFWLGDCYFNQQQYSLAIQEFNRVISDYQGAAKAPDALYKIAVAHLQLGQSDDARNVVELLNQRYPNSTATQKARELVIP